MSGGIWLLVFGFWLNCADQLLRGAMTTGSIIYLKCVIAGGIAVIASAIAVGAVAVVGIIWMSRPTEDGTSYGWDPVAFARTPLAWTIFLLAFAAGFYWQFHRSVSN